MWPGLVGKGPGSEPYIDLETMLDLTANARAGEARFDGVDLFLFEPHIDINSGRDDLARLGERIAARGLVVGSLVAPVWPNTGGGSAMGTQEERGRFLEQVKKACRIPVSRSEAASSFMAWSRRRAVDQASAPQSRSP